MDIPRKRRARRHIGVRGAPAAEILPPEAVLADDGQPVAADADDRLPPDLRFDPVPRRPRSNGLTPRRQRLFIKFLALTGSVSAAARAIGCSSHALYLLRQSPGADSFAEAWERAVERGARRVRDLLVEQAIEGIPEKIYHDGKLVAERRVFNTRAQMWIVAHYMPDQFGVAGGLMHGKVGSAKLAALKEEWEKERAAEFKDVYRRYMYHADNAAKIGKALYAMGAARLVAERAGDTAEVAHLDALARRGEAVISGIHEPLDALVHLIEFEHAARDAERLRRAALDEDEDGSDPLNA